MRSNPRIHTAQYIVYWRYFALNWAPLCSCLFWWQSFCRNIKGEKVSLLKKNKNKLHLAHLCTFLERVFTYLAAWLHVLLFCPLIIRLDRMEARFLKTRDSGGVSVASDMPGQWSAWFICCHNWKWAQRRDLIVSLQLKHKKNIIKPASLCNFWQKSLLYVASLKRPWWYLLVVKQETQPCAFTSVLLYFYRMCIWRPVLLSGGHMAPRSGRTLRRHALRPVLLRTCKYPQSQGWTNSLNGGATMGSVMWQRRKQEQMDGVCRKKQIIEYVEKICFNV